MRINLLEIRKKIIILIHRCKFINFIYRLIFKILNYSAKKNSYKLGSIKISEIELLKKPVKYFPDEYIRDNQYYGISTALRSYASFNNPINSYIEHGVFFGSYLTPDEKNVFTKSIIVMGNHRVDHLKKLVQFPSIPIGPYIHYASDFFEQAELERLKNQFGKTLLIFPAHNINFGKVSFNFDSFLKEISDFSKSFKTSIVCLYWSDIEKYGQLYLRNGFKVVSAGHHNDPFFLSRLKSIIKLSDFAISNSCGTHVGYCIYLNKPLWIIPQKIDYLFDSKTKDFFFNNQNENFKSSSEKESKCIIDAFRYPEPCISESQRDLVDYFWGLNSIKSKEELFNIFNSLKAKTIFQN